MEKALFMNGVYEDVLLEILEAQKINPDKVFYLQPYSTSPIKQLKERPPNPEFPVHLYISTTRQLNHISYYAEIIGWEDKNELSQNRLELLNSHIQEFQPKEIEIYFEVKGKKCVNLISITKLRKTVNQFDVSNLIKESNEEPLKHRTQAGGYSYVYALPLVSIDVTVIKEREEEELEQEVAKSIMDDDFSLENRLKLAPKIPEKVVALSTAFKRNADVIAFVLKRAKGKCELCGLDAPFQRLNDTPYLEVHHWITLADGGEDTVNNAGALCPNCHKNAHFGKYKDYIQKNRRLLPGTTAE
jgi:5-methylcytosine-specific restriction enzyme A